LCREYIILRNNSLNIVQLLISISCHIIQGLSDSDLERIVKNANKLRLLDVRGCTRISDSGLVRVPAWDLEHLYLSGRIKSKYTELLCRA